MRFCVVNLGCKVNRVESDQITADLLSSGASVDVVNPEVVVINTCTVTGDAEKKTRKAVRRQVNEYPDARIVVTGCAAAIDPDEFTAMSPRIEVMPKSEIVTRLAGGVDKHGARIGEGFPTRVGIKVQDGCDNACTYCIVHVARGTSVSYPVDSIVGQAVDLEEQGCREIILTGINLGAYRFKGCTLSGLLTRLLNATSEVRFRISSIEPREVDDELIAVIQAADGRICRHLHIPLQSGNIKVLCEMARPYDAAYFEDMVIRVRQAMPLFAFSTDIIVGFPGETHEEFLDTIALAKRMRFMKIHIFRYSKRDGTPAAQREDQIPPQEITQRANLLRDVALQSREADARLRIGTIEDILVESDGLATTESYYTVKVDETMPIGALIPITLTSFEQDGMFAYAR